MTCFRLIAALTLTALALSASATAGDSDTTEFRVDSYIPKKFTDFEWKLDGGMDLKRSRSDSDRNYYPGSSPTDVAVSGREVSDEDLDFGSDLRYRHETRQALWALAFYLDLDYDGYSFVRDDNTLYTLGDTRFELLEYGWKDYSVGIGSSGVGRRFVWSDFFLSWMLAWDYRYQGTRSWKDEKDERFRYESSDNSDRYFLSSKRVRGRGDSRTFKLNGELLLGFGRVYQGEYTVTAMFMIDELRQRGLLIASPSRQHMVEFTQLVHSGRLQHRYDDREHRAGVLNSLLSLLGEGGYIESDQAAALFVVEDVWDYFSVQDRRFGSSLRFGFGGEDDYLNSDGSVAIDTFRLSTTVYRDSVNQIDTTYWSESHSEASNGEKHFWTDDYFTLRFERYQPLSMRWQWEIRSDVFWHLNKPFDLGAPEDGWKSYFHNWREVSLATELQYFHDARTKLSFSTVLAGEWREEVETWPLWNQVGIFRVWAFGRSEMRTLSADMRLGVSYRISVPTRLQVNLRHYRIRKDTWYENRCYRLDEHGFSLSVGVTHWLY